jgi:hypothetical protein
MKQKKITFFKAYYMIMLIVAVHFMLEWIVNPTPGKVLNIIDTILNISTVILSIIAFIKFRRDRLPKKTLILQIVYLSFVLLMIAVGSILVILYLTHTIIPSETESTISDVITILDVLLKIFITAISVYMLYIFKMKKR